MKITNNFSYWEFGPKDCPKTWIPNNEYQKKLIDNLAANLQILIDKYPKKIYLKVTSGIRTIEDFYRLQGSGYNPSPTSDHFCGASVPIKDPEKIKKFGDTYNFSTGAADIVPTGISPFELFKHAVHCFRFEGAKFGQIIYEKSKTSEWVHLSGYYEYYFSDNIVSWLNKARFMTSNDGGKSYKPYIDKK